MKSADLPVTGPGQATGEERSLDTDAGNRRDGREDSAGPVPHRLEARPSGQDAPEPGDTPARGDETRRQATKVMLAAAMTSFFACLYVEFGDVLLLGAASTALALVVYWVAEHNRNRSGRL